ncbi:MAG: hypothetical protein II180_02285 [Proteobacteria bacterium]|nr:hypothetical protein [Pseudomonadota bacterium]
MSKAVKGYTALWHDINRVLWRCAVEGVPPQTLIRAELWRRVDHTRVLEKSASIRMSRKTQPENPVYRACKWLVEAGSISPNGPAHMPQDSALSPENAAVPAAYPRSYPGVDISAHSAENTDVQPEDHYETFTHAFVYAAEAAKNAGLDPKTIEFEFDFTKNRWRVEGTDEAPFKRISVNFYYLSARPKVWNAIFAAIVKKHAPSRQMAEKYVRSVEAQQLLAVYSDISPLRNFDVYDLDSMFDVLNQKYFNNVLPKPMLAWTRRANFRTLGTYNYHWDIICISNALNDKRVPEIAVSFVLYHEMLHIKHGLHNINGKAFSHTPEFRVDELKFEGIEEALRIHQNLRKILSK